LSIKWYLKNVSVPQIILSSLIHSFKEIKSRAFFIKLALAQKDFSSFLVLRVSLTLFNLQGTRPCQLFC
ncbi:hypothetical protein NE656_23020, partial [Flavonifractor plautii]|uniref:hypothetical protein n=1 Tax=Flavonifractor plautii TaxID=292800 RepID=UPI00210C81D0